MGSGSQQGGGGGYGAPQMGSGYGMPGGGIASMTGGMSPGMGGGMFGQQGGPSMGTYFGGQGPQRGQYGQPGKPMGGNQTTPQNPAALFAPQVYQQPFGQGGQYGQPGGGFMGGGGQGPMNPMINGFPGKPMGSTPRFANQQAFDQFNANGGMGGMYNRMGGQGNAMQGIAQLYGNVPQQQALPLTQSQMTAQAPSGQPQTPMMGQFGAL
jgi:hypothetical protein